MAIVDSFMFFNELDLLEIRLYELAPVVDRFILVESNMTHRGHPKELHYWNNRDRFKGYNIDVVNLKGLPHQNTTDKDIAFDNERYQRNIITEFLGNPEDIVMLSDLDEIPSRESVQEIVEKVNESGACRVKQQMYVAYLNMETTEQWHGTVAAKAKDMIALTPDMMRNTKWSPDMPEVVAGWHFSYMGGTDKIVEKIESIHHAEMDTDFIKDKKRIEMCLEFGWDILGRDYELTPVEIDDTFPHLLREQPEKFKEYLYVR